MCLHCLLHGSCRLHNHCDAGHMSPQLDLLTARSCADRAFCANQTTARLLINGEFKESQTDTWIDVTNPVSVLLPGP